MNPLRPTATGYDRVGNTTIMMRDELMALRERVTGRRFHSFPRLGGFDLSVWICMHTVTRSYDG